MTSAVPHQAIYRRWRAQTFREIVGQEAVVQTLRNAVRTERVAHAVLFVGPRGTGKTSLARILAKALNCTDLQDGDACDICPACVSIREGTTLDLVEIDAASNRGIDAVRDLRERLPYPPGELRRKVYILDEAHQITKDAWNALLKSLEEPPEFVNFMFASTEPSGFPPAILSRLQRYDVRRLTTDEIEGKLRRILEADGRTADPGAIHLIARLAAGGMRDAESMLDQLLGSAPEAIDESRVRDLLGLAEADAVDAFVTALVDGDAAGGIALLDQLEERGRDARILLDQTIEVIRTRLVASLSTDDAAATAALADAARRLASIDPDRAGVGGLRLQLELALFTGRAGVAAPVATAFDAAAAVAVAVTAPAEPARTTSAKSRPTSAPTPVMVEPVVSSAPPLRPAPAAVPVQPAPETVDQPVEASPIPAEEPPAEQPDATPDAVATPTPAVGGPKEAAPTEAAATATPTPTRSAPEPSEPTTPPDPTDATTSPTATGTVSSTPAVPAGELSLERLVAAWPDVVDLLSRQPAVKQLITTCRPIALDGVIVTLGFPEEQGFLRDVADRKRAPIEAGIAEVIGHEVGIKCVVANIEIPPPMAPDEVMAEAGRIFADVRVDVAEVD